MCNNSASYMYQMHNVGYIAYKQQYNAWLIENACQCGKTKCCPYPIVRSEILLTPITFPS